MAIDITGVGHVVLKVRDRERSARFYRDVLGLREVARLGVATPVNEAVVALYRRHGVGRLRPDPKNLEPLSALLGG